MELWIRSQDKTTLEKVSTIQLCENPDRSWFFNTDLGLILGKYKSKERALEVLDEIQNEISKKNLGYPNYTGIYEMPKE